MPTTKPVAFANWLPDLPALGNPGVTVATNVLPAANSYRPMPDVTVYSSALTARCQGAYAAIDSAGNVSTFAGDATKLYVLTNSTATYTDATRLAGGAYSTEADRYWSFTTFGPYVLATNYVDAIQVWTLGSSSNFSLLSGTPPNARYITVVRDQVVTAHLSTDPQGVRWSGIDDSTAWTASQTTLSDSQSLQGDHGHITGIVGGAFGIVFCERAVFRMDFVGVPDIYQFRRVEGAKGCTAPRSIVQLGSLVYYLADDGFYVFDGQSSRPIGKNRFDKTFYSSSTDGLDATYKYRITSTIDPINSLVFWAYPTSGATSGNPNRILVYNWTTDRASLITGVTCELLFVDLTKGYTLEGLDALFSSLDAGPFSLDSRAYTGGNIILSAFNSSHKQVYFTGSNLEATLETTEIQPGGHYRAFVSQIRPYVDGGTITAQLGTRELPTGTVSYNTAASINAIGYVPFRQSSRYFRARVIIAAGGTWTHAQGVEFDYVLDGGR